jgi:hypothetical protein
VGPGSFGGSEDANSFAPLSFAGVDVYPASGGQSVQVAQTDSNGRFDADCTVSSIKDDRLAIALDDAYWKRRPCPTGVTISSTGDHSGLVLRANPIWATLPC